MMQVAVAAGAKVTAVCSAANTDIISQLGAVRVIDYNATDFVVARID